MIQQFTTKRDIIRGFANAMNLISPEVQNHHEKVSYLCYRLAEAMENRGGERHSRNRKKKNRGQRENAAAAAGGGKPEKKERPEKKDKPENREKKPKPNERFDRQQENRQYTPPQNREKRQGSPVKNQAAAEKAEGGEKKANYHRRYFHRGSKKPGAEKKSED